MVTKVWDSNAGVITTHNNTSRLAKSKHSLGWMAARAGAMELEIAEKRARGYQTKAQVSNPFLQIKFNVIC